MALTLPVHADSSADGAAAGSPGPIAGNIVQLPVDLPLNVCGNTVDVAGFLNAAAGNSCADAGGGAEGAAKVRPTSEEDGARAETSGKDAPGVLSGNGVQLPVDLPVNASGNSVTVAGTGNAAVGNESADTSGELPRNPQRPAVRAPKADVSPRSAPAPISEAEPPSTASLAHTGVYHTVPVIGASAALVLGGTALYRRFRTAR